MYVLKFDIHSIIASYLNKKFRKKCCSMLCALWEQNLVHNQVQVSFFKKRKQNYVQKIDHVWTRQRRETRDATFKSGCWPARFWRQKKHARFKCARSLSVAQLSSKQLSFLFDEFFYVATFWRKISVSVFQGQNAS